ncbi:MAG TPA: hypothetical protein VH142_09225 [Polyangiaceae bacterium]|jgi:predicted lipid-binding transport protein (Tim44 family)|nr:hypothetical protein [Polyangiaceae bacterium]
MYTPAPGTPPYAPPPAPYALPAPQLVRVVDVDMPFSSLVGFLIKLALAAIPAMFIVSLFFGFIALMSALLFGSLLGSLFAPHGIHF